MVLYARKGAHLLAAPPGIPCPGYPDKNQHCLGFIRLARPASFQLGRDRVFRVEYGLVLPPTELTHDLKRPVRGLLSNPVFVELFLAADWPDGRLLELVRLAFACA